MTNERWEKKQKAEKVSYEDVGYDQYHDENIYACICPSCGLQIIRFYDSDVEDSENDDPKTMFHDCMVHHAYRGMNNFCNRCGQKLDWN